MTPKRKPDRWLSDDMRRKAREALKKTLSQHLIETVLETLPDGLTPETLDLLVRCVTIWQQQSTTEVRTSTPPVLAQVGTSEPETRLYAGWARDSGDPADLDRLRAMVKYREVWQRSVGIYTRGTTAVRQATAQIDAFWITTGHDVIELEQFMASVDAEFPDVLPG
ncbi:hypothetical protein [Micromonospora humida]|uniref:Uncharacterized protein n=1 Tax=Micromonospora humida TaxID=2809018 RepID=A0ABS2IXG0_9ACTN|nr:hypothetical protein [Micromonospora humida]MBM7077941.1 hypothetical protein [Micromonospora humida]